MIMNGATPRLVGVGGTLGSLALAVLLLPVNASWAQQSDEKQEVRIIVKTDDDATTASRVLVVPDRGDSQFDVVELMGAVDDAENGKVVLELKTDDHSTTVYADSIDEAIAKLRDQIKAISSKTSTSDKDQAVVKALESAIHALEKAGKTIVQPKVAADKADAAKKLVLRLRDVRTKSGDAASAGTDASIEEGRREIERLTAELKDHQRRLEEARRKLSLLQSLARAERQEALAQGKLANARVRTLKKDEATSTIVSGGSSGGTGSSSSTSTGSGTSSTSTTISSSSGTSSSTSGAPGVRIGTPRSATVRARIVDEPRQAERDQKRLAELEKKLDQLLEEVANLKKAKGK